ncbi:MAG TPA: hypothetical protein VKU01_34700 [Bryobacteraceae bacterium]|nr:hypothetical protein [Bryobacteraceae bacterium]
MYTALRPMLAVRNGDLWMMRTPFGRRGFFYETWSLWFAQEYMCEFVDKRVGVVWAGFGGGALGKEERLDFG